MFRDMDLKDIDIAKLETEATKELRQQATKAEEDLVSAHGSIPKDKVTRVLITPSQSLTSLKFQLKAYQKLRM